MRDFPPAAAAPSPAARRRLDAGLAQHIAPSSSSVRARDVPEFCGREAFSDAQADAKNDSLHPRRPLRHHRLYVARCESERRGGTGQRAGDDGGRQEAERGGGGE
eukprot:CAMPEP_0174888432 /NCGR_PEP_ID=MMETSP0167-20121228/3721_1 /TAXON_ID=38298 /ORGANISM="Rhodella maculata, Strain CCMP736" /LENGTH=104 /DNA_ID=CAMNT_0016125411 /DNA_START=249 /DNA_END=563 /DNA_ORIENTATION=-